MVQKYSDLFFICTECIPTGHFVDYARDKQTTREDT